MLTAFKGMRIITGIKDDIIEQGVLLVEDGRIKEIGEEKEVVLPPNCQVHEYRDKTLLPGFMDAHIHCMLDASMDPMGAILGESRTYTTIKTIKNLEKTVLSGITTIRDLGGIDHIDLELKRAIDDELILGPRMLASGKLLTMTGGHGHFIGREVDGPYEARKAAREQLKAGADIVKVMATGGILTEGVEPGASQLTREEMEAAIEEAHKRGKKTATHAQGKEGIKNAILAGIDSIEHGFFLDEEIITMMKERDIFYVPTLSATHFLVTCGEEMGIPSYAVKKAKRIVDSHFMSFVMAMEAGVSIAMGTDAGTPFNEHGKNLYEIKLMVENGMDPLEAICCGTASSARLFGLQDELGTLEKGKIADMVLLKGDPLEDLEALFAIEEVYKGGQLCKVR